LQKKVEHIKQDLFKSQFTTVWKSNRTCSWVSNK